MSNSESSGTPELDAIGERLGNARGHVNGILQLAERELCGMTASGVALNQPTGRRASLMPAGHGKCLLSVYDADDNHQHIELDWRQVDALREWLDWSCGNISDWAIQDRHLRS